MECAGWILVTAGYSPRHHAQIDQWVRFFQPQIVTEYDDFSVYYLIWEFTVDIVIDLSLLAKFDDERMFTSENTVDTILSGFMISRDLLLCLKLIRLSIL